MLYLEMYNIQKEFAMSKTKFAFKMIGMMGAMVGGAAKGAWGVGKQCVQIKNMVTGKSDKAKVEAAQAVRDYEATLKDVKDRGFDVLVIGTGIYLYTKSLSEIAPEVMQAYKLAYPNEFSRQDFIDQVSDLDGPEAVLGFTNGLKGKLFEIQYAKNLNENVLPEGYQAVLAESATQPGYDVFIVGPDNHVAETLQLKATQSVDYIKSALEKYPDIKVVSTDEVLTSVAGRDIVAQGSVMDSGISDHQLTETVVSEIDKAQDSFFSSSDQIPLLSLGIILFHEALKKNKSIYGKSFSVGERGLRSILNFKFGMVVASVAGGIAAVVSVIGFNYFGSKAETDAMLFNEYQKMKSLYQQKKADLEKALEERTSWRGKIKRFFGISPNW